MCPLKRIEVVRFSRNLTDMNRPLKSRLPFFYGWVIVAACFVAAGSYGLFSSFGVLFKSLQAEFGWSATLVSSIHSVHMLAFAVSCILMGRLTDRYGPRIILLVSAFSLGLGFCLLSIAAHLWHFYLFYVIASLGVGHLFVLGPAMVQRWFISRRGLALGIVAAGVGFGTLLIPPLVNYLNLAYGWRTTYLCIGLGTWLLISICSLPLVHSPQMLGLSPLDGDKTSSLSSASSDDRAWTTRQVLRTKTFWLFCFIRFAVALPVFLVFVHLIPYAVEMGIPQVEATFAMSIVGAGIVIGRIIGGLLFDKIGWKKGFLFFLSIALVALLWLTQIRGTWMLYTFSLIYSLAFSTEVPAMVGWTGAIFGSSRLGTILGVEAAISIIGGSIGPFIGGLIFDTMHSYSPAFFTGSFAFAVAIILVLKVQPPLGRVA